VEPAPLSSEAEVAGLLADVLGHPGDDRWHARRDQARREGEEAARALALPAAQLVYGELDLASLRRLLEAADLRPGEAFLDIGSGDGGPTLAAALLRPDLRIARGVEIVPGLWRRSLAHADRLRERLAERPGRIVAPVELLLGDVHQAWDPAGAPTAVGRALADTTLAVCFATTWSMGAPRRELPRLSEALARGMRSGSRVVVVDGSLLADAHGWGWEGDLRLSVADTAPHSTARLYLHPG
jgi:hypothetical protein